MSTKSRDLSNPLRCSQDDKESINSFFYSYIVIMNLHVYQWERYDRPRRWWIVVAIFLVFLLILTLWNGDWRGFLLLAIIIWWYCWYEWKTQHDMYLISLDSEWVDVAGKQYYWHELQWFSVWFVPGTEEISTLYIYTTNDTLVYSMDDPQEEISDFVTALSQQIPYIKEVQLSWVRKFMRMLKI